jgi:hypothetical protein
MNPKQCVVFVDRYIDGGIDDEDEILKALKHINYPIPPGIEEEDLFDIYCDNEHLLEEHFGEYILVNIYDTNPVYNLFLDKFISYEYFDPFEETYTEIIEEVTDFMVEIL